MHHHKIRFNRMQRAQSRPSQLWHSFTTRVLKDNRFAIPLVSKAWRIGARVFLRLRKDLSIEVSLTPRRSFYQGKLQSSRIRRNTESPLKSKRLARVNRLELARMKDVQ